MERQARETCRFLHAPFLAGGRLGHGCEHYPSGGGEDRFTCGGASLVGRGGHLSGSGYVALQSAVDVTMNSDRRDHQGQEEERDEGSSPEQTPPGGEAPTGPRGEPEPADHRHEGGCERQGAIA